MDAKQLDALRHKCVIIAHATGSETEVERHHALCQNALGGWYNVRLAGSELNVDEIKSEADLIVSNTADLLRHCISLEIPVFLISKDELSGLEVLSLHSAVVDVMVPSIDHRLLRRRADDLLVRLALERQFVSYRNRQLRMSFKEKRTVESGEVLVDTNSPSSSTDEASSPNLAADESKTDALDLKQNDLILDLESSVDEVSENPELHLLRKKSIMLQYQLTKQRDDSHMALQLMRQYQSGLTKVGDMLDEIEKAGSARDAADGGAIKGAHKDLVNSLKEIMSVVDKGKKQFSLSDLHVDQKTKNWLRITFEAPKALEIAPGNEEQSSQLNSPLSDYNDGLVVEDGAVSPDEATEIKSAASDLPDGVGETTRTGQVLHTRSNSIASASTSSVGSKSKSVVPLQLPRQSMHVIDDKSAPPRAFRRKRSTFPGQSKVASSSADVVEISQSDQEERRFCSELRETLLDEDEWNVWRLGEIQMMAAANEMLHAFGMVDVFGVKQTTFRMFFGMIAKNYKRKNRPDNPYHNIYHGFDVMKTCYYLLEICQLAKDCPNLSGYALLIAGLCHDVGHPGRNNLFQINTASSLAIRYNDCSVLESYHAALTFSCIRKCNNDGMYGNLDRDGRNMMRSIIVECILATDVSKHVKLLRKINEGDTSHMLQLKVILCCADVSNPIKPDKVFRKWTALVNEEFFQQGDEERELGMPVSPFFHRGNPKQAQLTVNFIDFIVSPIFNALKLVYPAYTSRVEMLLDILGERRGSIKRNLDAQVDLEDERLQVEETKQTNEGGEKGRSSPLPPLKSPNNANAKNSSFFARSKENPRPCASPTPLSKAQEKKRNRVAKAYGQPMP